MGVSTKAKLCALVLGLGVLYLYSSSRASRRMAAEPTDAYYDVAGHNVHALEVNRELSLAPTCELAAGGVAVGATMPQLARFPCSPHLGWACLALFLHVLCMPPGLHMQQRAFALV